MSREYLKHNANYWEQGLYSPNVESFVFRLFGRVREDLGLKGEGERLVDFGCGQGATVNYFTIQGFNAWGCDISKHDIEIARIRYPHIARKFVHCDPDPDRNRFYVMESGVDCFTAFQSLYYLSDSDFEKCITKIKASMKPGAAFIATMIGTQAKDYFDNAEPALDGLYRINVERQRVGQHTSYMTFVRDKAHLVEKFRMFRPLHIGYYAGQYRSDDAGDTFHWTFCGFNE